MKSLVASLLFVCAFGLLAADKKTNEYVTFSETKLEGTPSAGARVTAKLRFKIEHGFHTQSNKPSEEFFIPTELKLETPAGIKVGKITYPKGEEQKVEGLDKPLSVYHDEFEITVPLAISSQATLPATLNGALKYQACQGAVCFAPQTLKVEIKLGQ